MYSRLSLSLSGLICSALAAHAHQDGLAHAHPHVMISNETLAAALMTAALVLLVMARRALARRKK